MCVEPNVCKCNEGYVLNPEDHSECLPICSRDCSFGNCVGPEICECIDGKYAIFTNIYAIYQYFISVNCFYCLYI